MTQVVSALLSWLQVPERQIAPVDGRYLKFKPVLPTDGWDGEMSAIDPAQLFQRKWEAKQKHTSTERAAVEEPAAGSGPKLPHPLPVARFLPKLP